jgi:hypothetical protein
VIGAAILAGILLVLWPLLWLLRARENRRAILERLLTRVEGELHGGVLSDVVDGRHEGRPFRLRLGTRLGLGRRRLGESLTPELYPIRVDVALTHAPSVRLRVRRDQGLASVEKTLGLVRDVEVAGGERFDRDFVVEASDGPAATPLASKRVRDAVEALLRRWPLDEVSIRNGRIRVRGNPDTVGGRELDQLLEAIDVLARAYDRRPGEELGAELKGVFVWVGGGDAQARCPYCHDALAGSLQLVSCAECKTLLHAECHEENKGCPILGCGGRGAEWQRSATMDKPLIGLSKSGEGPVDPKAVDALDVPPDDDDAPLELPPDEPERERA